uniref:Uncharacterized protein n=1 Tax=Arundo donax TaxID=35708 RepID=A0A0A9AWH5_ARUDO
MWQPSNLSETQKSRTLMSWVHTRTPCNPAIGLLPPSMLTSSPSWRTGQ